MNQKLDNFIVSILLILAGILLKKGLIPNTGNGGKLWWIMILIGCMNILLNAIELLI
jgi:hypothetical protein